MKSDLINFNEFIIDFDLPRFFLLFITLSFLFLIDLNFLKVKSLLPSFINTNL